MVREVQILWRGGGLGGAQPPPMQQEYRVCFDATREPSLSSAGAFKKRKVAVTLPEFPILL